MNAPRASLWAHRDFRRLWAAQTVSEFGTMITHTALPFTAILVLDASALQVGLLYASRILPSLLIGLAAGVWVDRLPRRAVMIVADVGRAALLGTVPLAFALDALTLEHLYVASFLAGTLTIFFDVAYRSYLPSLVSREELVEGNSKLTASAAASEFGGFSVSGWLVQLANGPFAVLIDAVSFVASAFLVADIRSEEPPATPAEERPGVRREAADGMRTVAHHSVLRPVALAVIVYSTGFGMFGAVYMLFVTRGLGLDPGVLGVIFGIGGISSLLGAVFAGRAAAALGAGVAMIAGVALMGGSMLLVPLAGGAAATAALILVLQQIFGDGCFTVYAVNEMSLRQSITDDRMLGRVNSIMEVLGNGALLGGTLIGGAAGELAGLRTTLAVASALVIGAGALLLLSPVRGVRTTAAPAVVPVPAEA